MASPFCGEPMPGGAPHDSSAGDVSLPGYFLFVRMKFSMSAAYYRIML